MLLVKAAVQNFRSIDVSGEVDIDRDVTVFVGQNESGKTAFLQALDLCCSVHANSGFNVDRDYPRKGLNDYRRKHEANPAEVVVLTYKLSEPELKAINNHLGINLLSELTFTNNYHYKNSLTVGLAIDESSYVQHLVSKAALPAELREEFRTITTVRALMTSLSAKDLNAEGQEFLKKLTARFPITAGSWPHLLAQELWTKFVSPWRPKFFYFDDYYLLPGKVNLKAFALRVANPTLQNEEDKSVLSLLRLAGVDLTDLTSPEGYEPIKSRLEGLSISITDTIFKFWTQNQGVGRRVRHPRRPERPCTVQRRG